MSDRWTRRTFNQNLLLGAAATGLGCGGDPSKAKGAETLPVPDAVLLITADDLGWRDIGAYGLTAIETPSMDRLVTEGVAFANAFDVVSTCSSSRATYATGQYPHTHGVLGLVHRHPEYSLPSDRPNLARTLADEGMRTAIQGKWHLSGVEQPESFGYDRYLKTDLDQVIRSGDEVRAYLAAREGQRFYLELNYMQPHRDIFGEFPQQEGFEVDVDDAVPPGWWGLPNWPEIREEVAGYLSRVRWMDALIGEVLDALEDAGRSDSTLIAFISDNGPAFPGCKTTLYDRGVGTPLMFRWPAALEPAWHEELVSSVDLAPTLLDLAGAPPLEGAQGRSLVPLLRGDPDWTPADALFSEMELHTSEKPARAVRTERYKFIRNLTEDKWGSGGGNGAWKDLLAEEPDQIWDEPRPPEELFDLHTDPLERVNLIEDAGHADLLADLRARLDAHMEATADFRLTEG
jgi:arylsulfatase A-like enzyme